MTERRTSEAGFATATLMLLLLTLTASAMLLLDGAISERRRSVSEIENAQATASLEASLIWAATELAGAPEKRIAFVDTAQETFRYAGDEIDIELVLEGEKLDLNAASLSSINAIITNVVEPDKASIVYETVLMRDEAPLKLVDDLWRSVEVSEADRACLRKFFTVFGGQTDNLGEVAPTPFGRTVSAGRNFQVRATVMSEDFADQAVSAIILMTGIPEDPYWVLDWRYIASPMSERCDKDV